MIITSVAVFNVLNFFVTIGLALYFFRRYGVLKILSAMREEKQEVARLNYELKRLTDDCSNLEKSTKKQETSFRVMKKRFQIWQKRVELDDAIEIEQFELLKKKVLIQQEKKVEGLIKYNFKRRQLPKILDEAHDELEAVFSADEKKRVDYTKNLLKILD